MPALQVPERWTAGDTTDAPSPAAGWRRSATRASMRSSRRRWRTTRTCGSRQRAWQIAAEYAELADSTLWPQVNAAGSRRRRDERRLDPGCRASGSSPTGSSTSGVACARHGRPARRVMNPTVADAEYARQSIAALVAKSYFLAVEASVQLQLAEDMVAASERTRRTRRAAGEASAAATGTTPRSHVRTSKRPATAVEQFKLAREQALRALEALLGRYPAADVDVTAELARMPGSGAGRPAVGTARAPTRRRRGRPARCAPRSTACRKPRRRGCRGSRSRGPSTTSRASCSCSRTATTRSGAPAPA